MSGGPKGLGIDSVATIKHNGASTEPGLGMEERIRRKLLETSSGPLGEGAGAPPPDIADIALRDSASGRVRKVRAGSTRDSILGQAMALGWVLWTAATICLRHLMRGE